VKQFFAHILKPHYFFLVVAPLLFYHYNASTPPLQVSDEFNHFWRAYQISEGQFLPYKENRRLGGYIPESVDELLMPYWWVATNLKYSTNSKTIENSFKIKQKDSAYRFVDYPNTALYSPVSYAPQAFGMYVAKKRNLSMGHVYYYGRYFSMAFWMCLIFLSIYYIPFGKWLFTLLALLPMHVFVTNSLSADTVTNALAFMFIALCLHIAYNRNRFKYKHLLLLALLLALLALAKVVYIGLALMLLLIPKTHFKNITHYLCGIGGLFVITAFCAYYWSSLVVMKVYAPHVFYNPLFRNGVALSHCANYYLQKHLIFNAPWYFPNVVWRSISEHPSTYLNSYIGVFGNFDLFLDKRTIEWTYYAILITGLFDVSDIKIKWRHRIVFFAAAFSSFVLLLLSQHLTWDCVGEGIVDLIQGRYLIPIFPLIFLIIVNDNMKWKLLAPLAAISTLLLIHPYSLKVITHRYFVDTADEYFSFYCGGEKKDSLNRFLTSNPNVKLASFNQTSSAIKRSGAYSVKLNKQFPFACEYEFTNLKRGDVVEVSAWQKGGKTQIAMAINDSLRGHIYYADEKVWYHDSLGWGRRHTVWTIKDSLSNNVVKFFLWNTGKEVFIDDLHFSIRKFKRNYLDSNFIREMPVIPTAFIF